MELKLKNYQIIKTLEFLRDLKLKGRYSIARTRLQRALEEEIKQLQADETDLAKQYAQVDENGELIITDDEISFDSAETQAEYLEERKVMLEQTATIQLNSYAEHGDLVKEFLRDLDMELDGDTADIYDVLCEQLNVF